MYKSTIIYIKFNNRKIFAKINLRKHYYVNKACLCRKYDIATAVAKLVEKPFFVTNIKGICCTKRAASALLISRRSDHDVKGAGANVNDIVFLRIGKELKNTENDDKV
jgi:hypothetical protein